MPRTLFIHIPFTRLELFFIMNRCSGGIVAYRVYDGYIVGLWRFELTVSIAPLTRRKNHDNNEHGRWST
jgi:hypothetical protein